MVYGFKDYLGGKTLGGGKGNIIILLFIALFVSYLFVIVLCHSSVVFKMEKRNDTLEMEFKNTGNLEDRSLEFTLTMVPDNDCTVNIPSHCRQLSTKHVECESLSPMRRVAFYCTVDLNGTTIKASMRSAYQTTRRQISCTSGECSYVDTGIEGDYPVIWNYILFYPYHLASNIADWII